MFKPSRWARLPIMKALTRLFCRAFLASGARRSGVQSRSLMATPSNWQERLARFGSSTRPRANRTAQIDGLPVQKRAARWSTSRQAAKSPEAQNTRPLSTDRRRLPHRRHRRSRGAGKSWHGAGIHGPQCRLLERRRDGEDGRAGSSRRQLGSPRGRGAPSASNGFACLS